MVLSGTTVYKLGPCRRRGDTIMTGRFLTISGGLNPVSKSQIKIMPGFGWNLSVMAAKRTEQPRRAQSAAESMSKV